MACDLASDGQERDLKQGPMTARKAEADGHQEWWPWASTEAGQGHPGGASGDYHMAPRVQPETGSDQEWTVRNIELWQEQAQKRFKTKKTFHI